LQNSDKHMERDCCDLDRLVLEAVSQDYVPFESIVRELKDREAGTRETIRCSLLTLIAGQLVGAYLLHAESPFYTAVSATEDTLERYWFFISEEGERELQNTKGKYGESPQSGSPRVN
jgi:hypothetical protein